MCPLVHGQTSTGGQNAGEGFTYSPENGDTHVKLKIPGFMYQVDAHTVCKVLTAGGTKYFAPFKTSDEWEAFLSHTPSDVGVADCFTPPTIACYFDGDGDGFGAGAATNTTAATCLLGLGVNYVPNNTDCNDAFYDLSNVCAAPGTSFSCTSGSWVNTGSSCTPLSGTCAPPFVAIEGGSLCCNATPTATCNGGPNLCGVAERCHLGTLARAECYDDGTYNMLGANFGACSTEDPIFEVACPALCAGTSLTSCYLDFDGDGFGNPAIVNVVTGSTCPAGQVTDNTDCDDNVYSATNTCSGSNYVCKATSNSWMGPGASCGPISSSCNGTLGAINNATLCCSSAPTAPCGGGTTKYTCTTTGWIDSGESCGTTNGCTTNASNGDSACCASTPTGACNSSGGCFIAGSLVTTSDRRLVEIESIKVGDQLLDTDGKINRVMKLLRIPYEGPIYGINGGEEFFTPNHPLKTLEGWKSLRPDLTKMEIPDLEVGLLREGDILVKDTGLEPIMLLESRETKETVYNFALNGSHEFIVNDIGVHNKLDCTCAGGSGPAGWGSAGGAGSATGITVLNPNCAGGVDTWCGSGGPGTCYVDNDGDGYGVKPGMVCPANMSGLVTNDDDCDDSNPSLTTSCSSGLPDGTLCTKVTSEPDTAHGRPNCSDCTNPPGFDPHFACDGEFYMKCGSGQFSSCSGEGNSFCTGPCADV